MKIIFVCVENSNRSQMAEAFAKMYASNNIMSYSAGSKPSGIINPKAITAMKELHYDLSKHHSKNIEEFKNEHFDYLITMGCGDECPYIAARHRLDWQIPDPRHMEENEFRQVRNLIEKKVKELIGRLEGI